MMDLKVWVAGLPEARRDKIDRAINRCLNVLGLITLVALLGNLVAFNLPASLHCRGAQDYVMGHARDEQANPNAALNLPYEVQNDFCDSELYNCVARPTNCDDTAMGQVDRSRVPLADFIRPNFSQSLAELTKGFFLILWACLYNIGDFIWFAFNVPTLLSAALWLGLSIVAAALFAPVTATIASVKNAARAISNQVPALSRIGSESALGDAALATAEKVHAALTAKTTDFANEMDFEE